MSHAPEDPDPDRRLQATPGDVLLSGEALPYPGAILTGFRKSRYGPEFEPFLDFQQLQLLLEFLEHVVLCERLIVPIPRYSKQTERIVRGKKTWVDFVVFQVAGDLAFTTEQLADKLHATGVLINAEVHVGDPTADDVVARLMPSSSSLQRKFSYYLQGTEGDKRHDKFSIAQAHMAARLGAPLHIAEAAGLARVPFILSQHQARDLQDYERENLRVRRSVTEVILEQLNRGARKELSQLADLGAVSVFPETPIASMMVRDASSPEGLIDAAIQLRSEFSAFREHMNQIESELANENQPVSVRLKRLRELERLASSLWENQKTDLRANALSLSEALFAVPEAVSSPSPASLKDLAVKLTSLPVESLLGIYRKRKIRLLLKAKRGFLKSADSTKRIARIFGVPEEVALRSRNLKRPMLTAQYAKKNPEYAASWYKQN